MARDLLELATDEQLQASLDNRIESHLNSLSQVDLEKEIQKRVDAKKAKEKSVKEDQPAQKAK